MEQEDEHKYNAASKAKVIKTPILICLEIISVFSMTQVISQQKSPKRIRNFSDGHFIL